MSKNKMSRKKSQSTVEFVLLATFMLFVFLAFFIMVQEKMGIRNQEQTDEYSQQVMNVVVNEIKLAESVSDNYYKEFVLPNNINGFEYSVSVVPGVGDSSEIVIRYPDNREKIYFLETYVNRNSTIGVGLNNISKNNGIIKIEKMS